VAEKKAQDWRDTRRQYIQELKDGYPDIWLKEVKEKCQIGRAMAYRVLQLPKPENAENPGDASLLSRQTAPTGEVVTAPAGEAMTVPVPRELKNPKEVAADAMVMIAEFLERHNVDLKATRAELIKLLTEAQNANTLTFAEVASAKSPEPVETAKIDPEATAKEMGKKFEELDKQQAEQKSTEPKRGRGRPKGSKNKAEDSNTAAVDAAVEEMVTGAPVRTDETGAAGDDPYRIPDDLSIPSSLRRDQAPHALLHRTGLQTISNRQNEIPDR
jgi:hypothetical protein